MSPKKPAIIEKVPSPPIQNFCGTILHQFQETETSAMEELVRSYNFIENLSDVQAVDTIMKNGQYTDVTSPECSRINVSDRETVVTNPSLLVRCVRLVTIYFFWNPFYYRR